MQALAPVSSGVLRLAPCRPLQPVVCIFPIATFSMTRPSSPLPPLFHACTGIRAFGFPHTPNGAAGGLIVTAAALSFFAGGAPPASGGSDAVPLAPHPSSPPPAVIPMTSLILHAVCRDTSAFPHPCLYIELDGETPGAEGESDVSAGVDATDGGEVRLVVDADVNDDGGGGGGSDGGPTTPAESGGSLDALFAAVSAAASVAFAGDADTDVGGDGGGGGSGSDGYGSWGDDFFTAPARGGGTGVGGNGLAAPASAGSSGGDGLAPALGGVTLTATAAHFDDAEEAGDS